MPGCSNLDVISVSLIPMEKEGRKTRRNTVIQQREDVKWNIGYQLYYGYRMGRRVLGGVDGEVIVVYVDDVFVRLALDGLVPLSSLLYLFFLI